MNFVEFIVKYWLQVLFGLITTGAGTAIAFIKKRKKKSQERLDGIEAELNALRAGLLSVQGNLFRGLCEELLTEYKEIPLERYEQMEIDYIAYKGLGGNHRGDALHDAVVKKFNAQLNKN